MEEPACNATHFSHEHPLEYLKSTATSVCSGCKLTIKPGKLFYHCQICSFFLHKVCYRMPKRVLHPADPDHHLRLLAASENDQMQSCQACGKLISGFFYNCEKCNLYYHMLCIALPLSIKIPSSHPHVLKLELEPPHGHFRCDFCHESRDKRWSYRCRLCEFDAHVSCAMACNGSRSPRMETKSLDGDMKRDTKSQFDELMEILSEGMKAAMSEKDGERIVGVGSVTVLDQDALPSYQFSDACFSIDIARSIGEDDDLSDCSVKVVESKVGKGVIKRELSLAMKSTRIGSEVWEKLEHGTGNAGSITTNEGTRFGNQITQVKKEISRRSHWLKRLKCF